MQPGQNIDSLDTYLTVKSYDAEASLDPTKGDVCMKFKKNNVVIVVVLSNLCSWKLFQLLRIHNSYVNEFLLLVIAD